MAAPNKDPQYSEVAERSVIAVFNTMQAQKGKETVGDSTARGWLKQYRPKVAIHPHYSDYCDKCKHISEEISRNEAIKKRLAQLGNATVAEILFNEEMMSELKEKKWQHSTDAANARKFYNESIQKCREAWIKIQSILGIPVSERTQEETSKLLALQHSFTLVISADYQQAKLIPHWGRSAQPASTYYLQKVSIEIFGIVDHRNEEKSVFLFDERIGPKNIDHMVSFLFVTIQNIQDKHPWINRVHIFMDNASSTNKNKFLFAWGKWSSNLCLVSFASASCLQAIPNSHQIACFPRFRHHITIRTFSLSGS